MPKIVARSQFAGPVFQYHDVRIVVETTTGTERVFLAGTEAVCEIELMLRFDILISKYQHEIFMECVFDLGKESIVERLGKIYAIDFHPQGATGRSKTDTFILLCGSSECGHNSNPVGVNGDGRL